MFFYVKPQRKKSGCTPLNPLYGIRSENVFPNILGLVSIEKNNDMDVLDDIGVSE